MSRDAVAKRLTQHAATASMTCATLTNKTVTPHVLRHTAFVRLAKTITRFRTLILNAVDHALSNARSEATNTHLQLLTRRAYGYHSPESLIAMPNLTRGGLCPPLPGQS